MLINKHNLAIAPLRSSTGRKNYAIDLLHFTRKGTMVVGDGGAFAVRVSPLRTTPGEPEGSFDPSVLSVGEINTHAAPQSNGKIPPFDKYMTEKPNIYSMTVNPQILLKLAQSIVDFDGGPVRIQITGEDEPIKFDCRNVETGQTWEAIFAPFKKGSHDKNFEVMSDLERALAEAAKLCE